MFSVCFIQVRVCVRVCVLVGHIIFITSSVSIQRKMEKIDNMAKSMWTALLLSVVLS